MPKVVDHIARRREITQIAINLIADGGLEAATFREIASASGYSKGVVEHYFDNKEAIISAALLLLNENYNERAEKESKGARGLEAIRRRLRATLPLFADVRMEWKVRLIFWGMAAVDDELQKQQAARLNAAAEHFAKHFAEAIEDGEFSAQDTAKEYGRRLVAITSGLAIAALHDKKLGGRQFLLKEIDNLIHALPKRAN